MKDGEGDGECLGIIWLVSRIEDQRQMVGLSVDFRVVRYMVESVLLMRVDVDVLAIL